MVSTTYFTPGVVALLRQESSAAPVATLADSTAAGPAPIPPNETPWPEPTLVPISHFAFGAVEVPYRYRRAWRELLARCPDGLTEWQWTQAIYDARDLFETWGAKIEEMRWDDDSIFERPHGLIWFLQGEYVTFPGGMTAHTSGKRIWRRPRR